LRPAKAPRLPAALPGAVNETAAARYPRREEQRHCAPHRLRDE